MEVADWKKIDKKILKLYDEGFTYVEIAEKFNLNASTLRWHCRKIYNLKSTTNLSDKDRVRYEKDLKNSNDFDKISRKYGLTYETVERRKNYLNSLKEGVKINNTDGYCSYLQKKPTIL